MNARARRRTDRPPWAWRLLVRAVLWFLRRVMGWRTRAHLPDPVPPPQEPLVVVFNHTSAIDAFVGVDVLWQRLRHWCRPLVKAELFDVPVLGPLARAAGAIPVARGEGGGREAAYANAVDRLREGGTVMVAPEGTTTHDGSLLPLRHGAARLALEAGVDVLVATHFGAQRAFSPVVRFPERDVVVDVALDVLHPWPDDDAGSLTGRIAATMLDRGEQLQASYPQADPTAHWWPPYAQPASPTATARENLERYREAMAEAVVQARERMARYADEYEVDQRLADARERAVTAAGDLAARSRLRAEELAEQARHRYERFSVQAEQARHRYEQLSAQARGRAAELGRHFGDPEPPVDDEAT